MQEHLDKPVEEIKKFYDNQVDGVIEEYVDFLMQNDLAFLTQEPGSFPDLDTSWQSPSLVTNALLEIDASSRHNYAKVCKELDELGCKALQIKLYTAFSLKFIRDVLHFTSSGRLEAIELLIKYTDELDEGSLLMLAQDHPRISQIVVHSAPRLYPIETGSSVKITFIEDIIESAQDCGCIHPSHFRINVSLFTESLQFNSCLNRKVAIDAGSRVKNCPAMQQAYGNVNEVSLHNIILNRNFTELWNINKDQVEVCKDCEFRYICTDCRAFISNKNDIYSKPAKCSYNPYTATWENPEDSPFRDCLTGSA